MKHLTIICSGEYVSLSLQAEFGKLIPAMLPLGNRFLVEHQVEAALPGDIMVTIPDDINKHQITRLTEKNSNIILYKTKNNINLSEALLEVLNDKELEKYQKISIILGDSLIKDIVFKENTYSAHKPKTNYAWSTSDSNNGLVFSGYIMLSCAADLISAINYCKKRGEMIFSQSFFKTFNSNSSGIWYDFGHYHNYHTSKRDFISHRYFNSIKATEYSIIKSSVDKRKMIAEAEWYFACPKEISYHCPKVYEVSEGSYEIEYLYANTLSELSIYSNLPDDEWSRITDNALCVLEKFKSCSNEETNKNDFRNFLIDKTCKRMENINEYPFDQNESILFDGKVKISLNEIKDYCVNNWPNDLKGQKSFVHGDFCFSNLLYDARSRQIKMIDPRGIDEVGEINSIGFLDYDVAKFAHSYVYLYDKVLSGDFKTKLTKGVISSNYKPIPEVLCQEFWEKVFSCFGISEVHLKYLIMNLYLSMIPLHKDNKECQLSFAYIVMYIYLELKRT